MRTCYRVLIFLKPRLETYLTFLRHEYRKPICRLRISANKLLIELDRYINIPRTEKNCKKCALNQIKNEEHFLMQCSKFTIKREQLFDLISYKVKQFTNLQDKQKKYFGF